MTIEEHCFKNINIAIIGNTADEKTIFEKHVKDVSMRKFSKANPIKYDFFKKVQYCNLNRYDYVIVIITDKTTCVDLAHYLDIKNKVSFISTNKDINIKLIDTKYIQIEDDCNESKEQCIELLCKIVSDELLDQKYMSVMNVMKTFSKTGLVEYNTNYQFYHRSSNGNRMKLFKWIHDNLENPEQCVRNIILPHIDTNFTDLYEKFLKGLEKTSNIQLNLKSISEKLSKFEIIQEIKEIKQELDKLINTDN